MKSLFLILSKPRYFSPAIVFTSLNIWFGTWAIYIPSVKDKLGIDKAEVGIAIFFLSIGVFTMFPIASKIINRLGVGKATWFGIVLNSIFALLPLVISNYYLLCAALFFFGASNGLLDIAMNTLVTEIEKEDKKSFMSAAHGFFSLGGIFVGLGSFLIAIIGNPFIHMFITCSIVFGVNFFLRKHYYHIKAAPVQKEPFSFNLFKPLLLLGIIGFVSMGSEGAIIDWSGLYLREITLAPEFLIGAGFLAFSTTMTIGRFFGDLMSQKMGSVKIIAVGAIIAMIGYSFILSENTYLAIIGFALNGFGFSVMVPELFRIGGTTKGVESSQGVAFIAGMGYLGFLSGPVVLGFLAENTTLKVSFWTLFACVALVLVTTIMFRTNKK